MRKPAPPPIIDRYIELIRQRSDEHELSEAEVAEVEHVTNARHTSSVELRREMAQLVNVPGAQPHAQAMHLAHVLAGYRSAVLFDGTPENVNPFEPKSARSDSFEIGRGLAYRDLGTLSGTEGRMSYKPCGKAVGEIRARRNGYAAYVCVLPPNHGGPCSAAIGAPAPNAPEGT